MKNVYRLMMMRIYSHFHTMSVIIAQSIHTGTIVLQMEIKWLFIRLCDKLTATNWIVIYTQWISFLSLTTMLPLQSKYIYVFNMRYLWKYTNLSETYTIIFIIYIYKSYDKLIMTDQITNKLSWTCWYVLSHILFTLSSLIFNKGKYPYQTISKKISLLQRMKARHW